MIKVSEQAAAAIAGSSRTFLSRFLYNDKEIGGDVRSVIIYKGSCGDSMFATGAVFSSYIDVVIDNCNESLAGKELTYQIGVVINEFKTEWYDIGKYTVHKPSKNVYTTTFTALGRISAKMGKLYVSKLVFPTTIQKVLDEISEATGITIDATAFNTSGIIEKEISGYMYKEVLAIIAGIFFGYATEDTAGTIVFSGFKNANKIKTDGDRTSRLPTFADEDTEITGVKVTAGEYNEIDEDGGEVIKEKYFVTGTANVSTKNEFMTQALFDSNVGNVVGYAYRPAKVSISLGDFRIEPFDYLQVTDSLGVLRNVPCMSIIHRFDGGLVTEIVAPDVENSEEGSTAFRGLLTQAVERYQQELLIVKTLLADTVSSNYLEANYASIAIANVIQAEIESLKVSKLDTDQLVAKVAELGYLNVKDAEARYVKTEELETISANIETAIISIADIKYASIAMVEVQTAKINKLEANKLDVNNLSSEVAKLGYASVDELNVLHANLTELSSKAITTENLKVKVADLGYAKVTELEAVEGKIDSLEAKAITADTLESFVAEFGYLKSNEAEVKYATISNLEALNATLENLSSKAITTENITAKVATLGYAKIIELEAVDAKIDNLAAVSITTNNLAAEVAVLGYLKADNLETEVAQFGYLKVTEAALKYATITSLESASAQITDLTAKAITTENLSSKVALLGYAKVAELEATEAKVDEVIAVAITTSNLSAKVAELGYATIDQLEVEKSRIDSLETNKLSTSELSAKVATLGYATVKQLKVEQARISSLETEKLNVADLEAEAIKAGLILAYDVEATYATIVSLNAISAKISTIESSYLKTSVAEVTYATIKTLESNYATIKSLNATDAKFGTLSSVYATIDLANVKDGSITTAMIGTGVVGTAQIADGSITDAKIVGLTANKITAGTLDAGTIEVINLKAANITVGTINGKQIANGAIDINKLDNSLNETINSTVSDVATALENAGIAITNAAKAQTTADGKNTVFYQASTPSTIGRKKNDVWFETDNGNKMYYWNGSAWTAKLFDTAAIDAEAITAAKIASGAITTAKLDANSVVAGKIAADAVTASTIATGAVTTDAIAANAITSAAISANAVTSEKIVAGAVTADKIASRTITANKIASASITGTEVAANTIKASHLSVDALSAISANLGIVTAGIIQSENYQESSFTADRDGNITGSVLSGVKIDLNNEMFCTPQITIRDNHIVVNGYLQIGTSEFENANGLYTLNNGLGNQASGDFSHAEGAETAASGSCAHSEGVLTLAAGMYSHAEGNGTESKGKGGHSEGLFTKASSEYQHVQGKYNIEDSVGVYAHIIGNGTSLNNRSNAYTLDWGGNAWYAGNVTLREKLSWHKANNIEPCIGYASDKTDGTFVVASLHGTKSSLGLAINGLTEALTYYGNEILDVGNYSEYALPLVGGKLTGELIFDTGSIQSATKGIKWSAIKSKVPYIGYATDQSDGTFVWSIVGTNYASGLAIGGGSGNLLYKANAVLHAGNYTSYCATVTHAHSTLSGLTASIAELNYCNGVTSNIQSQLNARALKENSVFYVEGTGTTAGTWLGSHPDITSYYTGLMIAYKVGIAGVSGGTTLNINGLGTVSVVRNATSAVTTHYGVGSVVFLVYTVDSDGTAYWKTADYDANNYAYVRQYVTTANANYPLLFKYDSGLSTTTNYVTKYSRYTNKIYANPSTGTMTAVKFAGDLAGNAATATRLENNRAIQTNLSSGASASFNGTADITPGVTGILGIANGGTGADTILGALRNLGVEYGTWTPTTEQFSAVVTAEGSYVKINNLVIVSFYMQGTSTTTGEFFAIGNLPFSANTANKWYAGGGHAQGLAFSHENAYFTGWVLDSSKQLIYGRGSKSVVANADMTGEYLKPVNANTAYIAGTLMYKAA